MLSDPRAQREAVARGCRHAGRSQVCRGDGIGDHQRIHAEERGVGEGKIHAIPHPEAARERELQTTRVIRGLGHIAVERAFCLEHTEFGARHIDFNIVTGRADKPSLRDKRDVIAVNIRFRQTCRGQIRAVGIKWIGNIHRIKDGDLRGELDVSICISTAEPHIAFFIDDDTAAGDQGDPTFDRLLRL